jgi:hypothetical protein
MKHIDTSFLLKPVPEKPGEKFNGQGWGYLNPDILEIADMWNDISMLTDINIIVEIGMFAGHSTVCLLEHFPKAKVTSLDPGSFSKKSHVPIKERYGDRFTFIDDTLQNSKINGQIDFMFIDGDHCFESVSKDIKTAFQLKPRYILFDNVELPGVRKAIKESKLFSSHLNPKYWFYVNQHKGEMCPGILMLLHMESKYE